MRLAGESAPVYAWLAALRQAELVMPGAVLETEVKAAIAANGVRLLGDGKATVAGSGWVATLLRCPSPLLGPGREVWKVMEVKAA